MCTVIRAQLRKNMSYVVLDRFLRDGESAANLPIPVTNRDEPQYLDLAGTQVIFSRVIGEFSGNLRRDAFLPAMHGTNDLQEFRVDASFQEVTPRAGLQRAKNLDVARIRSQHNDARIRR